MCLLPRNDDERIHCLITIINEVKRNGLLHSILYTDIQYTD